MPNSKLLAAKRTSIEFGPIVILLVMATALRLLWLSHFMSGPGLDAAEHIDLAAGLSEGRGYEAVNDRYTSFVSPLFPVLVSACSAIAPDIVAIAMGAGRTVSVVFGALLVVPVYLIARRLYGTHAAVIAAGAVATHPLLVHLSAIARPDITCLSLVMSAVYFQVVALRSNASGPSIATGILYGLAALTRPEVVVSFAATTGTLALVAWRESRRRTIQGTWMLMSFLATLAAGAAFVLVNHGDLTSRMIVVAWTGPTFAMLLSPLGLSLLVVLALAMVGLLRTGFHPFDACSLLFVALVSTGMGLAIATGVAGLVAGILPVALIWTARGVVETGRVLAVRLPHVDWMRVGMQLGVVAVAIGPIVFLSYNSLVERNGPTRLIWDSGWWLASVAPAQKRVMDTSVIAAVHAGALYVPFPTADSRSALESIAKGRIDYLVLQKSHIDRRSYLREWFERGVPDRRARLVSNHVSIPFTAKGRGDVLIYKWVADTTEGAISDNEDAELLGQKLGGVTAAAGPLRVSAANPRYFADPSGQAVYLTGFHTWSSLQDAGRIEPLQRFDFNGYLSSLNEHRVNFVRLWASEQADWVPWAPYHFRIAPVAYLRTGPGVALDGRPKFDLSRFDDEYFDRLRRRVRAAGDRGVYVSVMLFQGWSVARKGIVGGENPWNGHPFNRHNNVNGIDGDARGTGEGLAVHTLDDSGVRLVQEAYVEKVIDTVNDLDNVLFEICNECDGSSVEWQYHIIRFIKRLESVRPKQHPVGMTIPYPGGHISHLKNSPADWISPAIDGGYQTDPEPADGSKVIITDTDHLWGLGGDRSWVWKSFARGLNPIFMDAHDNAWMYPPGGDTLSRQWDMVRRNMGYTAHFAAQMNMNSMLPRPDLCSPSFCLARPGEPNPEYLVYSPNGGRVSVDVRLAGRTTLNVEWFDPSTGSTMPAAAVQGGVIAEFVAPSQGDAVLHLFAHKATGDRLSSATLQPK